MWQDLSHDIRKFRYLQQVAGAFTEAELMGEIQIVGGYEEARKLGGIM